MTQDTLIAVFTDHTQAEAAVRKLADRKFDMKQLSIVGQGYHTEENVVGFYNTGDRIGFWGRRGAFWGGLWGLFFGGVFLMVPVIGPVMVLGYLATVLISAIEGAVVVGGLSVIGAALVSIGIPKDSVIQYETVLKADGFLVTVHGSEKELEHAREILEGTHSSSLTLHHDVATPEPKQVIIAAQ